MSGNENVLFANNISVFARRKKCLLSDISFALNGGEIHALLGPNGAGKSTLLKALSGDVVIAKGEISIDGEGLGSQTQLKLAKKRAVLPQLNAMAFALSVEEIVAMGRNPYADSPPAHNQQCVANAMQQAQVQHLRQRAYPSLSGGEQQRTQLARVLAQNTDILLLDEPLSALDIAQQLKIMNILQSLAKQGKAIVIVLHDINLALRYATHVTLLNEGRVQAQGETLSVLGQQQLREVFSVDSRINPCELLRVSQATLLSAV